MLRRIARIARIVGIIVVVLAIGVPGYGCCVLSAPTYHGAQTTHFDADHDRFHDDKPYVTGFADLVQWTTHRQPGEWPEWIDAQPGPAPERRVDDGRMRVTFVNHATVLLQVDGINILTDPIWSERASPFSFVGPKRVRPPGIRFEDLPPIDVVLISHNHYDHMNVETLLRLRDAFHPLFITGLGNDALLASAGIEAKAVDWWQAVPLPKSAVVITSVPNQHFSNRGICDWDGTLWTAFVVDAPKAGRAYFAGDTGYGAHFADVAAKFPGLRLAVLPIGAYKPEWFMSPVHMSPAQAVQAQRDLKAGTAVAIHFGTFPLADDGYDEPVKALLTALDHAPSPQRFWALGFGEGRDVP